MAVGDRLSVLSKGEELIDPDTGFSLGSSDTVLGEMEVEKAEEKFSIARNLSLSAMPSRGDSVEGREAAASIEFASRWKNQAIRRVESVVRRLVRPS